MPTPNTPLVTFATAFEADAERIRCVLDALGYAPRRLMPDAERFAYALPLFAREHGLPASEASYLSALLSVRGGAVSTSTVKVVARSVRVRCGLASNAPVADLREIVRAYTDTVTAPEVPA